MRIAIWGAGFFARKWAETIVAHPGVSLAGVASRSPERAAALLKAVGARGACVWPAWGTGFDRSSADAVVVALPQAVHPQAVIAALDAGWNVLVEKPLALDLDAALGVLRASRAHAGQVVMVNQNFRWRPHVQTLRRALRDSAVGTVGHVMFECRQQIRRSTIDGWRERMTEPYLLDFAVHHFDMIRYLLGDEPAVVSGRSFRPPWSWFDGQSAASALIEMRSGAMVDYGGTMVSTGWETPQEGVVTVVGERGTLCLDAQSVVRLATVAGISSLEQEPVEGGELGYALREFLGAIRERREPEVTVEEHLRSLAIAFAVIESGRTGCRVDCRELLSDL